MSSGRLRPAAAPKRSPDQVVAAAPRAPAPVVRAPAVPRVATPAAPSVTTPAATVPGVVAAPAVSNIVPGTGGLTMAQYTAEVIRKLGTGVPLDNETLARQLGFGALIDAYRTGAEVDSVEAEPEAPLPEVPLPEPEDMDPQAQELINKGLQGFQALGAEVRGMGADIQAMIFAGLEQTLGMINQMEQQFVSRIHGQMGADDPAIRHAIGLIRDEVTRQRQESLELLNARGLSQSGQVIELLDRLSKTELNQTQALVAGRISDLQNQLNNALMHFFSARTGAVQTAQGQRVSAALGTQNALVNVGGQASTALLNAGQFQQGAYQWGQGFRADQAHRADQTQFARDQLNWQQQTARDQLNWQQQTDARNFAATQTQRVQDEQFRRDQLALEQRNLAREFQADQAHRANQHHLAIREAERQRAATGATTQQEQVRLETDRVLNALDVMQANFRNGQYVGPSFDPRDPPGTIVRLTKAQALAEAEKAALQPNQKEYSFKVSVLSSHNKFSRKA